MTLVEREVRWVAALEGRLDRLATAAIIVVRHDVRQAYCSFMRRIPRAGGDRLDPVQPPKKDP
jgi:hypothetical protein